MYRPIIAKDSFSSREGAYAEHDESTIVDDENRPSVVTAHGVMPEYSYLANPDTIYTSGMSIEDYATAIKDRLSAHCTELIPPPSWSMEGATDHKTRFQPRYYKQSTSGTIATWVPPTTATATPTPRTTTATGRNSGRLRFSRADALDSASRLQGLNIDSKETDKTEDEHTLNLFTDMKQDLCLAWTMKSDGNTLLFNRARLLSNVVMRASLWGMDYAIRSWANSKSSEDMSRGWRLKTDDLEEKVLPFETFKANTHEVLKAWAGVTRDGKTLYEIQKGDREAVAKLRDNIAAERKAKRQR
ncbi:uncharacterized protein I303_105542 [Kwoniella dejecticola CBS 10117]|uniref:Uncharacterized protein n=1 Tax=Kwoniella dejecticola CBS 10117 TaxID=1296121 RepID=A0A1A6A266_9TREE|nr:uncharacterized protein I303_05015 [Kwoniella dejecticola CBS 10117]OBR84158.1 hypothetical protein I303_05015 [Kwoniella dejecticola CBS 10117]